MRKFSYYVIWICLVHISGISVVTAQTDARSREILRQIDDLWRGDSSYSQFTMKVQTEHYTRTMKMEGWSKGTEQTLVRILSPLKEKGTATLKSGSTIYTYLPKTDRTIRLTSGMMGGSWMGSHFTNDDLVQESRMEEDFTARISFEGARDGKDIIVFELIPKPDAAVVWGKIELVIYAKGYLPIKEVFYDEDMKVTRTMSFSDIKPLAGKLRPAVMRLTPADKPNEYTEFIYDKLDLNVSVKDSFFSLANLKRY